VRSFLLLTHFPWSNHGANLCSPYTFSGYDNATQPITIYVKCIIPYGVVLLLTVPQGLIPGGQTTTMNPPNGPSYHWTADVGAGTTMVFLMIDADDRQGGSSDILTVASSSESSCLDAQSPTSTASPSASGTAPPVVTETASSKTSVGAIAGTALGALVALVRPLLISVPFRVLHRSFLQAVLVTLGLFFLKKWRDDRRSIYDVSGLASGRHRPQRLGSTDNIMAPQSSRPYPSDQRLNTYQYPSPNSTTSLVPVTSLTSMPRQSNQYEPRLFNMPSSSNLHSRSTSKTDSGSPSADGELSQARRQKAAMAGVSPYKPSRFILHTDVDEAVPVEGEDVVELPPQYTDRRQPPSDVHRQPSSSVRRQPSNGVRRRPSGNVPPQDIPPVLPNVPRSPGGQSQF
jgi:hypothetical protein